MAPPNFRSKTVFSIFLVFVALMLWIFLKPDTQQNSIPLNEEAKSATRANDKNLSRVEINNNVTPPDQPLATPPPSTEVREEGKEELKAYQFAVRGGVVSLNGIVRIAGDFHRRRGPKGWMPGMWCVRLLDADMRVIAEETVPAPDEVCVVLDPEKLDSDGTPQASQLAGSSEESMLQVRLPPHPNAKWVKIYRLSSMERADWKTEPSTNLLTTIPLQ